jgi:fibronectin type 3 domain-containing protein
MRLGNSMQNDSYDYPEGGPYETMQEMFDWAVTNLHLNYVMWNYRPTATPPGANDYADALVVIENNPTFGPRLTGVGTSYDHNGLAPLQQVFYKVSAVDASGAESVKSAIVSATSGAAPAPPIPVSVSAVAQGPSTIRVSWSAGPGTPAPDNYKIYRSSTGAVGSFTALTTDTASPYDNIDLPESTTFWYQVSALAGGVESDKSVTVSAKTSAFAGPNVPTNVMASAQSASAIRISWRDSGGPAPTNYKIYHSSTGVAGSFSLLASPAAEMYSDSFAGTPGTALPSYNAAWVTSPGSVAMKIGTANNAVASQVAFHCNYRNVTVDNAHFATIVLDNPINTARPGPAVRCQTNANSFYCANMFNGVVIPQQVINGAFTHWDAGHTFSGGDTIGLYIDPAVPTTVYLKRNGVTIGTYTGKNALTGGKPGIVSGSPAVLPPEGAASWTGGSLADSYDHTGLGAGEAHYYQVSALNADGESARSPVVFATTGAALTPSLPTGLSANGINQTTIRLTWAPGEGGSTITGFKVFRSNASGGTYTQIGTDTNFPPYEFDNTGLGAGETWWYKLRATDGSTDSALTPAASGQTHPALQPAIPVSVTAVAQSASSIKVAWLPGSGGSQISGFKIYRAIGATGSFSEIHEDTTGSPYEHVDTGLSQNVNYFYRVTSFDATNESDPSSSTGTFTQTSGWPIQAGAPYTPAVRNRRGFAMDTRHAFAGGTIKLYRVNTVNYGAAQNQIATNDFRGGLGAALNAAGPRIIVFETSGSIQIPGTQFLNRPNLWIAAQTAPNPGITLYGGGLVFVNGAGATLIQHLRTHPAAAASYGFFSDGSGTANGKFVFDHCEVAHTTDTTIGWNYNTAAVDVIETAILWAWYSGSGSTLPLGEGQISNFSSGRNNSWQGCFFAHHLQRDPLCRGSRDLIANNASFNCGFIDLQGYNTPMYHNIIGNLYRSADTATGQPLILRGTPGTEGVGWGRSAGNNWDGSQVWLSNNAEWNGSAYVVAADQWNTGFVRNETLSGYSATLATSTSNGRASGQLSQATPAGWVPWTDLTALRNHILARVGARPNNRSGAVTQALNDWTNGTLGLISSDASLPAAARAQTALAQNAQTFSMPSQYGASHFANSLTESGRLAIESYLLDLGESV